MNPDAFDTFKILRKGLKDRIAGWSRDNPGLPGAQTELQARFGHAPYPVETPIVYNGALDEVTESSDVRLILVADNPGIQEQKAANRAYLVGQSGKLASSFFRDFLGMDFRTQVLILNKTPVHTPRTRELGALAGFYPLLEKSQRFMAETVSGVAAALSVPVWIIGYSELPKRKLFSVFAASYAASAELAGVYDTTFVFRHFSMNQFSVDFRAKSKPGIATLESLESIGAAYRDLYLGPYLTV